MRPSNMSPLGCVLIFAFVAFHSSLSSSDDAAAAVIFKDNRTYFPIDLGKKESLYCFQCDECFVPTNLILCPKKAAKCYFEHVLTYEHDEIVKEHVTRRCHVEKTNHEDECDVGLLVGKKLFACVCSFDACNSHAVMMGPTYYQRYYHVPKTLAGVDFPGWAEGEGHSTHQPIILLGLSNPILWWLVDGIFSTRWRPN